jgi:t-SNARE complex subunit (syntaxin)
VEKIKLTLAVGRIDRYFCMIIKIIILIIGAIIVSFLGLVIIDAIVMNKK